MNIPLKITGTGPTQVWTINVPHVGNAITGDDFIASFEAAVDYANLDTGIRALILTGAGEVFSGGAMSRRWRIGTGSSVSKLSTNAMRTPTGSSGYRERWPGLKYR